MHTSPEGDRSAESDRDPAVTGPHAGFDCYGRFDHYYYRCERCGLESTDASITRGCPECHDPTGGRDA